MRRMWRLWIPVMGGLACACTTLDFERVDEPQPPCRTRGAPDGRQCEFHRHDDRVIDGPAGPIEIDW